MITDISKNQIILRAAKGKVISNGDSYGEEVWLAPGDKPENWIETDPPLPPEEELPMVKAELEDTKTALTKLGVTKVTTWTAAAEKLEPIKG